ncbi:hypothetical protein, partial [Klebsiella variicola]|uniref:hypothetical protein n=1 Tax=Klebsiella variicola TaxID=244366 RepID=UPI00215B657D
IGPDPRNFNQRVSLGRNDLLIRTFPMPELLNHWTVDEVAECLDGVGQELYRKLWSYIEATTDGEAPLAKVAWGDLTREHKVELVHAIQQEFPDDDI